MKTALHKGAISVHPNIQQGAMKYILPPILFILLIGPVLVTMTPAQANPFTSKPTPTQEKQVRPIQPPSAISHYLPGLIRWQEKLRRNLAQITLKIKETRDFTTLFPLFGFAFLYGAIHSAGPGHGKAVAMSYILSVNPSPQKALAFGNTLAFTHGISGILLVVAVNYIFKTGMGHSLATTTRATQILSFSLVCLLGLFIIGKTILGLKKKQALETPPPTRLGSAVVMGIIPCPGVVMVTLFALSLDLLPLGIFMGLAISCGMAVTISLVILAGVSGKTSLLKFTPHGLQSHLETGMELFAGGALFILGSFFLLAIL